MDRDKSIFNGLEISKETALCEEYMGKYPVVSISLKGIDAWSYETAYQMAVRVIIEAAAKFYFLLDSEKLNDHDKADYKDLLDKNMNEGTLGSSLRQLSGMLEKHYGTKVIVLIDEYDVPLAKAHANGYYDQMVSLIRSLLGEVLKTNNSLKLAVLTGCLRISKESIFTGLNNLKVLTIADERFDEYFGFTDEEVRELLEYYDVAGHYDEVKRWYDGYQFGNVEVYCPWDVVSYCHALRMHSSVMPQNYWVNTSSNSIIRKFIEKADATARDEIELLISGERIYKKVRQELTYRDLDSRADNLWSILFAAGYLTQCGQDDGGRTALAIPNREIQWIFREQIQEWFETESKRDIQKLERFCRAFEENETAVIEKEFTSYLRKTISIRDTGVRKDMKENFYHGILLGLFGNMDGWKVRSNAESGDGYCDISVEVEDRETGIVIELKYAENAAFDNACKEALKQIRDRNYGEKLADDGMTTIRRYGIACYKRRCRVEKYSLNYSFANN